MINRGRIGFQEGGNIIYKGDDDFFLNFQKGVGFVRGPNGWEFNGYIGPGSNLPEGYSIKDLGRDEDGNIIKEIFKDPNSTGSNVIKDLSAQEQNERETRRYESFEINPITGNRERVMREGNSTSLNDPIVAIFDKEKGFVDLDTPTKYPFGQPQGQLLGSTIYPDADSYQAAVQKDMDSFSTPEVPTVDPFSGQQVSAQDQAAFTQPQDIFPQQESTGLNYLMGMPDSQPVSQLGRQGILNLLTSNFNNLDLQTMNEIRNNPDAFNLSRGSGALTAGSLLPKFIKDFQYAAPQGTDINQLRNLARETASNKSFTDLIKDVYNDPAKFDPDFKPKAGQIKTGYPQYLKEGILSAVGFQPTSQIGGGTDAARALLEKIKSIPGAQTLGKVLPGVGIASGTYDVGSRLSQGDYFGAGLGALSAVPFVGIPAAAAQAAYDYRQPLADMIRNVVYRPGRG